MKNQKGQAYLSVILIGLFILLSLGSTIFFYKQNQDLKKMLSKYTESPAATLSPNPTLSPEPPVNACTEEAKICPDGSSVVRSGPKCEFEPCPVVPGITNLKSQQKIASPQVITGVVPPGWMFEGVFPVKLISQKGTVITQVQAKENVPGSWQSGKNVNFTAKLEFSIQASGSGLIRLENDNPSGLPENAKKFELPVTW
jgi:hypothetical protein